MDITGSMGPYLTQVQNSVINIINRITLECPGIDINMGYIGYTEVCYVESNQNIEFTKSYQDLEKRIKDVRVDVQLVESFPCKLDRPEDMAWAMERALEKNWKSNARFAILLADESCHGYKYHSSDIVDYYPDGGPNRINIEVLIRNMAEKNISLFCARITPYTDIMFGIFEDIYNYYTSCKFKVVPLKSDIYLSDTVVDSAADIYVSQRDLDN